VIMRSEYFDPIERFPEKIDELLGALNWVCFHSYCMKCMFIVVDL
jgi:hypothetical protein